MRNPGHEVPAHLRKLPRSQVPVRVTRTAADVLLLEQPGWQAWTRGKAYRISVFLRQRCGPTPRAQRHLCPYTPAEKTAMRRLVEQLEKRLWPTS